MKLSQIPSTLAQNMGYDVEAMNDQEKVTVVRRRVVYEEVVMSMEQFEEMNNQIQDEEFYLGNLQMTDIQFPDLTSDTIEYVAFPGDVTSFTDDAIAFLFEHQHWTDSFEPVQLAS